MLAAAIWSLVFLFIFREFLAGAIFWIVGGITAAITDSKVAGFVLGLIAFLIWEGFAVYWIVEDIINIISIASGHA